MKRILIVGNSHAGALKRAWDRLPDSQNLGAKIEFFVAPSPVFSRLGSSGSTFGEIATSNLTANEVRLLKRINGATTVDLEAFDEVLLIGMFYPGTNEVLPFLESFAVDGLYEAHRPQRLTERGFTEMLYSTFESIGFDPVWQRIHGTRVTFLLRPMPIDRVRSLRSDQVFPKHKWSTTKIEFELMQPLLKVQRQIASAYYSERNIRLMHQPDSTLLPNGLTKDEYCRDDLAKIEVPGGVIDVGHMNGDFGRLCLEQYFNGLELEGTSARGGVRRTPRP